MFERLSFIHVAIALLVIGFIVGIAVFVLSGATTNKGTAGAISAEYAKIVAAEKQNCHEFGTYGSISAMRKDHVLTFQPVYNSVVYIPGKGCGSIVVGSAAYEASAG